MGRIRTGWDILLRLLCRLLPLWLAAADGVPRWLRLTILLLLTVQLCLSADRPAPWDRFWQWLALASGAGLAVWGLARLLAHPVLWLPLTAALAVLRGGVRAELKIRRICAEKTKPEKCFAKNQKKC